MCRFVNLWIFVGFSLFFGIAEGGTWSETGEANLGRSGSNNVLLTDGKFMALGGMGSVSVGSDTTYEIFDPATGTWTQGSLPSRGSHSISVLLYNGKIYCRSDLYDPSTGNWTSTGLSYGTTISQSCYTMLKDGNVIYMHDNQNCKVYDWVGNTLTTVASANAKHHAGIEVLLPSGEVLVAGGDYSTTCELYDPGTQTWRATGPLNTGRSQHLGVLLPSPWNQVLIAGGSSGSTKGELYDLTGGTWSYTVGDQNYFGNTHAMALLPSGRVLVVGGHGTGCEIYDPDAGTWSVTDAAKYVHNHFSVVILPTGKILAIGSHDDLVAHKTEVYDPSDGVWDATKPSLNVGRSCHTTTPLPIIHTTNCSTNVLVVGGENPNALKSCELYNYMDERVTATGALNAARTHHTAVLLSSGEVLAAGGKDGGALASSELFNVVGETWSYTTGAMSDARFDHSATLLKDGRVLVTGGESSPGTYLSSCETYSGGSWTSTASAMAAPRARHSAVILLNGDILVIGGQTTGGAATNACEIWNGTSWSGAGSLTTGRYLHSATLLQSGKVLVTGGTSDGTNPLQSCEIYDPVGNSWSAEADLNTARYLHNTTLLYSGLVLVTGGNGGSNSCEIWDPGVCDPATGKHEWKTTQALATGRAWHSSVLIPDAQPYILAIGGDNGTYLNSIEEYDVGLGYRQEWQSTITNYPSITHISPSMDIQGTLFRGVSEADGGNHCHVANNDHPIISLVRVGGGNWQGNGGGAILHMPSSSSWNESHTTVDPTIADFQGYYRLWSIANGIPSKWYEECVGVEGKEQSTVHGPQSMVFPNPSTAGAGVHFRLGLSTMDRRPSTLTICDLSGRSVRSVPIRDSRFTIQGLKPGIYFYRIELGGTGFQPVDMKHNGKFIIAE
jgi:hypothetical protein